MPKFITFSNFSLSGVGLKLSKYEPLPNIEAIAHLDKKTLLQSYHYLDILAEEHAIAFTVSKMMDKDLLVETKQAMLDAMKNGTDFNDFQKRLKPYLMSKGWWGEQTMTDPKNGKSKKVQLGSTRRLRTIYHTNKHTAYAAGQWQRIQATKKTFPYLRYTVSVSANPRLKHKKYYNLVLPVDHPIWQSIMPPNGWGCLCGVQQLTQAQAEAIGITEDFEAEWEEVINERTGKKVLVPKDIDVSFAHNHGDRLGAISKLAVEKHGSKFVESIRQEYVDNGKYSNALMYWLGEYKINEYLGEWHKDERDIAYNKYKLTEQEYLVIKHYTGSGHITLKDLLENYHDFTVDLTDNELLALVFIRELLNKSLDKMPKKVGRLVRRTELSTAEISKFKKYEKVTFNNFTSSTYGEKDVIIDDRKNVRFVIFGKNGRLIEELSDKPNEKEVLFKAGTVFSVVDIVQKDEYMEITLYEWSS